MELTSTENRRHVALTGAYNFRDLGGYHTRAGSMTKWHRFLRADSPHRLSEQDVEKLLDVGLRTVIDMRSVNEVAGAPNPFAAHTHVTYHNIELFDHLSPDTMQSHRARPLDDPLFDFYVTTLATRQAAIRDVLGAIATAPRGTVMFHCTAGKDRTGLISALLLGLADVEEEDIVSDYVQTGPLIRDLVREFLEIARTNGTDLDRYRRLLACEPDTMRQVVTHIHACYQSVPGFVARIGLDPELRELLTLRLLA